MAEKLYTVTSSLPIHNKTFDMGVHREPITVLFVQRGNKFVAEDVPEYAAKRLDRIPHVEIEENAPAETPKSPSAPAAPAKAKTRRKILK